MKVIVLGLRGFPNIQGGVEKHCEYLYPLLVKYGCQVEVVVRSQYVNLKSDKWKGVFFKKIWAPRIKGVEALFHTFFGILYASIKRPDIIHIHAIGPAIMTPVARILGLRVIVTHHGPDYDREKWGGIARWVLRTGEKWGMRYANDRIVISEVIRQLVSSKYHVEAVVIPNGIRLPAIPTTTSALEKYDLEKQRYILLVSRFVPEKRHLDLINAFNEAKLSCWKLVLVGDSDHPDEYSKKVNTKASITHGVILTGYQSGLILEELYANAGLFILPSSHEGLPIAMLEALSYGVPVIASSIPANLEVGLSKDDYYPLGDIPALTYKIKMKVERIKSTDYDQDMRNMIMEKYNWDDIAEKTYNIYTNNY